MIKLDTITNKTNKKISPLIVLHSIVCWSYDDLFPNHGGSRTVGVQRIAGGHNLKKQNQRILFKGEGPTVIHRFSCHRTVFLFFLFNCDQVLPILKLTEER